MTTIAAADPHNPLAQQAAVLIAGHPAMAGKTLADMVDMKVQWLPDSVVPLPDTLPVTYPLLGAANCVSMDVLQGMPLTGDWTWQAAFAWDLSDPTFPGSEHQPHNLAVVSEGVYSSQIDMLVSAYLEASIDDYETKLLQWMDRLDGRVVPRGARGTVSI